MVWTFKYEPSASYPEAELVEGSDGPLELVDPTRDGGIGFVGGSEPFSGRRVKPDSLPRVIRFLDDRPLQDFENQYVKTVSPRLRALIEEIEPDCHQFEPVQYIAKDGKVREERWFWQLCNRLDSVHPVKTTWVFDRIIWRFPPGGDDRFQLFFDLSKIGDTKFWNDKHLVGMNLCSDDARERLLAARMTGLRFKHYPQAEGDAGDAD